MPDGPAGACAAAAAGISASQYGNFLGFLAKLDSAVEGQKEVIRNAESKVQAAKLDWQGNEKKRLSYNTLDHRVKMVQQKKDAKSDQKQTDDFAARAYFYKSA